MIRLTAVLVSALLSSSACAHATPSNPPSDQAPVVQQPVNTARTMPAEDARVLADFNERLATYSQMHQRLEATLPPLSKETTPEVIDRHQRGLEKLIRSERRNAVQGELLTPGVRRLVRQLFARVFAGKEGADLKATILDENPGAIRLMVNSRYPDDVPLSTVPPQVLSALPKLPAELEYRFIGERLVLLDVHAHTIADFMDNAFPR